MWDKYTTTDKLATLIAYLVLPVTYPIHCYNERKYRKKLALEKQEQEKIRQKNLLR